MSNIHDIFNFTELNIETVVVSLRHSCGTVIISQGISLHYNPHNKAAIYLNLFIYSLINI